MEAFFKLAMVKRCFNTLKEESKIKKKETKEKTKTKTKPEYYYDHLFRVL